MREIYEHAMNEPSERRLQVACLLADGDRELESEVIGLLSAHGKAGAFLASPVVKLFASSPESETAGVLEQGRVLNKRFEILRFLNSGGMGAVYEAWDRELKEIVALKTILPDIAADPSVIHSFKEEVRQARQIAHPNICRVYDLFCDELPDGEQMWFLTMQLLKGGTLKERLREKGPYSPEEALPLIDQMIAGLTVAHDLGIVHRDFKSANVMLTVEKKDHLPRPVIMDFGLAARITANHSEGPRGQGSPAYVAPEQWYEGVAGPAADQYSLGVVLCEMVTGQRPVLSRAPDGSFTVRLPQDARLKPRWAAVICRCTAPLPDDRFESLAGIMPALDPTGYRRLMKRRFIEALSAVLLAGMAGLFTTAALWKPSLRDLKRLTPIMDLSTSPSLSRDGSVIAYMSDRRGSGASDIWVQHLPDGVPVKITDDVYGGEDPSISPDGKTVVFSSRRDSAELYMSSTEGGPAKLLAPSGRNPRFSPDGRSVLYWTGDDNQIRATASIHVADLVTGRSTELASDFTDARDAVWNSDGRHILFKGCPPGQASLPACWEWWVTTTDGETPRNTKALALLAKDNLQLAGEFGGWYGTDVLFTAASPHGEHLWQLTISPDSAGPVSGLRELIGDDPRENIISSTLTDHNIIALTEFSSAVHTWKIDASLPQGETALSRVTQDGDLEIDPSISANGQWMIFARGHTAKRQLWVREMTSGRETAVLAAGADKHSPVIDEHGATLAYEAWQPSGVPSVMMKRTSGGESEVLCTPCRAPTGWFGDWTGLLMSNASLSEVDLYRFKTGELQQILRKPKAYVTDAVWSPANEFLLFTVADDQGHRQAFATHFPRAAEMPDEKWIPITVPSESVRKPHWSADGKTVYYLSNRDGSWCVWAQSFDPAAAAPVGEPRGVQHFHAEKFSPNGLGPNSFNLSASGNSVYLNIAEMNGTIWTGTLERSFVPFLRDRFR